MTPSINNSKKEVGILIMMSGLPGVGKSTLANRIVAELHDQSVQVFQVDRIRKALFAKPTYSAEESAQTHEETQRRILASLLTHDVVIYDATNMLERFRAWSQHATATVGAQTLVVAVEADVEIVKQRLEKRSLDPSSLSEADFSIYQLLAKTAESVECDHLVVRCQAGYEHDFELLIAKLKKMIAANKLTNPLS